ncbi:unnamed protein product [Protopolystoma xenopodis]|uniref:Uncharacterized protein n=1 Tax=Protopolystoma xenopodis TaxID=117903 RepID=A0A448XEB0_9PLAT|nr:unnamed protein product [Protopolystoma xenopodis]
MVRLFPKPYHFFNVIEGDYLKKQRQPECSSKANRQLVKRNRPSSSGGIELRISSRNTFTRNGSKLNKRFLET